MGDLHFITISTNPKLALQDAESRRLIRTTATRASRSHKVEESSERHRTQSNAIRENSLRGGMGRFRTTAAVTRQTRVEGPSTGKEESTTSQSRIRSSSPPEDRSVSPSKLQVALWDPIVEPLGGQAWALLHYYRYSFRARSWAINAKRDWFAFVIEDQAATHATLSFVSLNRDLEGDSLASAATLHHRSKALQLIRQRLVSERVDPNDSLIGAVALLAITDGLEGHHWSSTAHVKALTRLVSLRGGLEKLHDNEALSRLVAWADLCHTSTFSSRRRLPSLFELSDLTLDTEDVSPSTVQTSAFQVCIKEVMFPDMYNLVKLLAAVPKHPPSDETSPEERQNVSRLIYYINQLLLSIHHEGPILESNPVDRLAGVLCYTAHLYISLVLRQMPRRTKVVIERAERLLDALNNLAFDSSGDAALQDAYLLITLWARTLYFCSLIPQHRNGDAAQELRRIIMATHIEAIQDLESRLGQISWVDGFCRDDLERLCCESDSQDSTH